MTTSCWTTLAAKRGLLALALPLLLAGCGEQLVELSGPTMGSQYHIKYLPGPDSPDRARVQGEVDGLLDEVDRQMSTWRDDSLLSAFNRLPAGSCQTLPAPLLALVEAGQQLARSSDGAFDLTVGPLLDLWGFGPQSRSEQVPATQQLEQVRQRVGYRHLRIDAGQLCKGAAVEVDLGSIAAGDTVDRLAERFAGLGIDNYLIEITGELKAAGRKPDGSPWRVAIEAPQQGPQAIQQVLALDGLGVSTSGDYRNYYQQDGRRYSHTLDPRTGAPVTHALASVTVIDPSTRAADGLSTLLMVLGPDDGLAYADRHGIAAVLVSRDAEGFSQQASREFIRRFGTGGQP